MKFVLQLFKNFYIRFIQLLEYIRSFEILLISIFSIFITFLSIDLFEKLEIYKNERHLIFFFAFLIIIIAISYLIVIWNFSQRSSSVKSSLKYTVQILFFSLILAFSLTSVFVKDLQNSNKIYSFTPVFREYDIHILDIDRSRGDIQEIVFELDGVRGVGYLDWFEEVHIGDLCNIYGVREEPKNFDDFDYIRYLKNRNIYIRSSMIEINNCGYKFRPKNLKDLFLFFKRSLRKLRESLSKRVERYLPEPQSSLLIGVLFGSERAFSEDFESNLRVSGTTHIIAASGYNITILILASNKIFAFINKKYRLIISIILIWIYCILSGLGASILRATVMGTLTIISLLSGEVKNIHLLLPLGVFFLVLINPKILFDIGFQLSILATLGLIYLLPSIEECLKKMFKIKSVPQFLEDNLLGTISCTLSTLPISISIFQKVSLVSIFSNVLILPLTESTMLYGTISLISSFFFKSFSQILFSIPYVQLKIFELIVNFFGNVKWGYLDIESSWLGLFIGILLLIFCIYFYPIDQENYYAKRFKDI